MDTFGEMNGWIALSLTLLLGQAPSPSPDERPFVEPAPRQGQTPTVEELERTAQELEVKQLRAEVELLRAQVEAQQQEDQNRIQTLEQQKVTENARARALEELRQQCVARLRSGYQWMVTADQLLEEGDFSVGPALAYARQDLSEIGRAHV